jgi:hypothetical protein
MEILSVPLVLGTTLLLDALGAAFAFSLSKGATLSAARTGLGSIVVDGRSR